MGLFDYPTLEASSIIKDDLIFLEHWSETDWESLKVFLQHQVLKEGETLFKAADKSQYLSIVIEGQLGIFVKQKSKEQLMHVSTITEGSVVGEQAFIDGLGRSADVKALKHVEVMNLSMVDYLSFKEIESDLAHDLIFDLSKILSVRLRRATQMITETK
jgi:CRP/FNR family cyclic AMP-dependent transcriptional regulator